MVFAKLGNPFNTTKQQLNVVLRMDSVTVGGGVQLEDKKSGISLVLKPLTQKQIQIY